MPKKPKKPVENLNGLLDQLCGLVACDNIPDPSASVTMGDILDTIGRRAYGPLLLAIGLFSISPITAVPGLTWFAAGLTLIIALQLMFGMENPWLPKAMLDRRISSQMLVKGVEIARPWAKRIDVLLKPRLVFLAQPPFVWGIGALCAAAALITFPLGFVPLLPMLPGLAVVLFGLGLAAKDGLLLAVGALLAGGAGAVALRLVNGFSLT